MKVGYDPITPQKEEGAWFGICRDGRLLAATLLLALLSSSFTAMSLYQLAALQADLMNLRMELQSYRGSATPAAAGAPELTAGVKLLTPAAPRPHNSSRGHRNRRAFQGPEETGTAGAQQLRAGAVLCTPASRPAAVNEALCVAL